MRNNGYASASEALEGHLGALTVQAGLGTAQAALGPLMAQAPAVKKPLGQSYVNAHRNHILGRLPHEAHEQLAAHWRRVLLHQGAVLQEAGTPAEYAYFVESGLISMVMESATGWQVEAAVIGHEGVLNGPALWVDHPSIYKAVVLVPGSAYRIPVNALRQNLRGGPLQEWLLRHSSLILAQTSQSALCGRLHTLEERLSRWLLTTSERTHIDEFEITHECIANMLGARRSAVTIGLGTLQQLGIVDMRRGMVHITDSVGLQQHCCECHGATARQFHRYENC